MKVNSLKEIYDYTLSHDIYLNLEELYKYKPVKFDAYLNENGNYDYFYHITQYNMHQFIELDEDFNLISYVAENNYQGDYIPFAIIKMCLFLAVSIDEVKFQNELNDVIHMELKAETKKALEYLTEIAIDKSVEKESIHIEPNLELVSGALCFTFKIGRVGDKFYVLKNLDSFIESINYHEEVRYGKNLCFTHYLDVFDEESQKIIEIIRLSNENRLDSRSLKKDISSSQDSACFRALIKLYINRYINFTNTKSVILIKEIKKYELFVMDGKKIYFNRSYDAIINESEAYILDETYKELAFMNVNRSCYFLATTLKNMDGNYLYIKDFLDSIYLDILPNIKNYTKVLESFYEGIDIPEVTIDSRFMLNNNDEIEVKYDVTSEDESSPFTAKKEKSYLKLLTKYGFENYLIKDIEHIYNFLTSDLSSFNKYGKVLVDEALKKRKVIRQATTRINVSYGINMLNLKIENDQLSKEELARLLHDYNDGKKFFVLEDNSIMKINEEETRKLVSMLNDYDIDIERDGLEFEKPSNYLLKLVHQKDDFIDISNDVKAVIDDIVNYKKSDFSLESHNELRPYQEEAYKWLKTLDKYNFGGILADEMGLGKSLEMLTFMESDEKEKPSLIVSPMSLVFNWAKEITKWTKLDYQEIVGSAKERHEIIEQMDQNKKMIYLTSYDSLRQDIEYYKTKFRYIVIDEAQYIKNKFAKKTESVKSLTADNRFALTGTPIENSLADLWSIFDFVMPNYLSSYNKFKDRYEDLIYNDDKETLNALVKRVTPFILRRTKKDCLKDLPDRIEMVYTSKMEQDQRKLYDAYLSELKSDLKLHTNKIQVLSYLTKLREICVHPGLINEDIKESSKFKMLEDLLVDLVSGEHRVLIFSQFVSVFPYLEELLKSLNLKYFKLTGQTKSIDRIRYVDEFNENEDIKVFLISLKAGGTGLNLVGADTVIHLDPWWNVSSENQASDRVHRIGQTKNVTIIKMICENTIEEKVLELQKIKKDLANKIIDNDLERTSLTTDDIEYLLE